MRAPTRSHGYWAPKLGSAPAEWEDAIALSEATGRFAVADGASSSFEAGRWARALVAGFVADPPTGDDAEAVDAWVRRCAEAGTALPSGGATDPDDTPWYVDEAAVRGAFATFAGLEVRRGAAVAAPHGAPSDGAVTWSCLAVGDCCLFHVRDGALLTAFPLDRAHDFDDEPHLLTSVAFAGHHGGRRARTAHGVARSGDALVLATDGLATWALARSIGGPEVWDLLARIDHPRFAELVGRARRRGEMADDDVALVRCTIE